MDVRTRKNLTMPGEFQMKSSTLLYYHWLYIKRKDEGRGLISVYDSVKSEEKSLNCYVLRSEEWMLKVVGSSFEAGETNEEFKNRMSQERMGRLNEKRLHGKYLQAVKDVANERSWQWIRSGNVAKSTAFVFAAQEKALRTRWLRAKIEGEDVDPNWDGGGVSWELGEWMWGSGAAGV